MPNVASAFEAAFDIKKDLIGTEMNGIKILDVKDIPKFLKDNHIDVAVLCVPKTVAIPSTKVLTDNGINAIWNFTNVELIEPNSPILVENMHFSDSLLSLSYFVSDGINEENARQNRLNR